MDSTMGTKSFTSLPIAITKSSSENCNVLTRFYFLWAMVHAARNTELKRCWISYASYCNTAPHTAAMNKWFVLLGLVKCSHYRPNLGLIFSKSPTSGDQIYSYLQANNIVVIPLIEPLAWQTWSFWGCWSSVVQFASADLECGKSKQVYPSLIENP